MSSTGVCHRVCGGVWHMAGQEGWHAAIECGAGEWPWRRAAPVSCRAVMWGAALGCSIGCTGRCAVMLCGRGVKRPCGMEWGAFWLWPCGTGTSHVV